MTQHRNMGKRLHDTFNRNKRANGQSSAKSFSYRENVRNNTEMFKSKKLPRPAHAALDLVQNEHRTHFATALSHSLNVLAGRNPYSGIALDGLHNDTCGPAGDLADVVHVIKVNELNVWQ